MSTTKEGTNSPGSTIGVPAEAGSRVPWRGLALTFAALAMILLATTVWGLPVKPEGDYNLKLVLGLITFFGTLLTLAVSFIGVMLKDSVDHRTLGLKSQAEARLRMDTSLTAVGLMGGEGREGGAPLKRAGALMALANLGHESFALGLLDELWGREAVPSTSAVWLIDRCLLLRKPDLQEEAANLLRKYSDRLLSPEGRFLWPRSAFDEQGINSLSPLAAFWSLEALLGCLTSRPRDEWDWEYLNEAYVLLDLFQANENTRYSAAGAVRMLMEFFLPQVPEDNQSRRNYEESLKEAQAILSGPPSSDSEAGRIPYLLDNLEGWLSGTLDRGNSPPEDSN